MIKALVGYDIEQGVSESEYEKWLFAIHAPDLLANPYLERIVFNKVLRPVTHTSGGAAAVGPSQMFYRIAEMHFADSAAYAKYREWFDQHPIPADRGPGGRTAFRFYLIAESQTVDASNVSVMAASHGSNE
jgi:hypothetical protein